MDNPVDCKVIHGNLVAAIHGNLVAGVTGDCGYGHGNLVAQTYIRIPISFLPIVGGAASVEK